MKNPILLQKPTSDHCGPGYVGKSKYLETKNLLSEFDTEEKRLTVLRNLGILNNQIDIVQELGDDTSVVMSQKAVTDAINNNKNIEIYESENNLPTSAATGRIAAVVYQTNNETVNRLYFKNEEAWKSINDVKIVDAENKLDPSAPQGTIAVVAINTKQKFLSDLNCPRDLKTAEDFEQLEFIEEPLVINAPTHVDIDLSEELIILTFAQDFYIPKQTDSTDILPNLPHYIYIGKFDTLTSDGAAWGIYHFSQALGGGIIAEYDSNGDRISYNERQIQDLNLYLKYQYRYKYWVSKKTIPNYDIVNTFIAVGQTVMTTVPYIKDFDKWTSLLNTDILYIDEAKLYEYEVEQDGTSFLVRVPKDRLKEITRGVDFIDFKNYSRICVGDNIYPLFLEDGMYTTPIRTLIEEDYALQIWPMVISGFSDSYTFQSGYAKTELAGITIANDYSDLSSDEKVGSIATTQESVDDTKTVSEYYEQIQGNFPTRLREVVIDPKEYTDVRVEGYHYLEMYIYNLSIDGKPVSQASPQGKLTISEFNPNYSSENAVWGIYCSISSISQQESAVLEYDQNGNRITWNPDALTAFNNSKLVGNAGGKVYGGYISDFDPYLSVLDGILYFSNTTTKTTLYLKHDFNGWEKYYSPIKNNSIKLEHLSDEVTKTLKGVSIYDSIDKLDKNAEQGSLASVAIDTLEEISFSELYQPTEEDFSSNTLPIAILSKVSGISVIVPDPSIEPPEFEIELYSEDFNPENGVGLFVALAGNGYVYIWDVANDKSLEFELFIYNEDENTLTLNEENLTELNNILSEKSYVYGGTRGATNEDGDWGLIDPSVSNSIYRAISGEQKTDLHIKDIEGWRKLNDVKIVDSVDKLDPNAKQGTLATVAINTLREIKWSEVYQPTEEELSQPFEDVVGKLTRISKFEVTPPESMDIMPNEEDWYVAYLFSGTTEGGFGIGHRSVGYFGESMDDMMMEAYSEDDVNYTWEVYRNFVQQANELLSKDPMYYLGSFLNDEPISLPPFLDEILHIYTGEVSTELYIKTEKGWTPYKESDTLYIDYNSLWNYEQVDLYEDDTWYFKIPFNEFAHITKGVNFNDARKYRFVSFDGIVEPLCGDGHYFWTNGTVNVYESEFSTEWDLSFWVENEYVYVGTYISQVVKLPLQQYQSVDDLPLWYDEGGTAVVFEDKDRTISPYELQVGQQVLGIDFDMYTQISLPEQDVDGGVYFYTDDGHHILLHIYSFVEGESSYEVYATIDEEKKLIALYDRNGTLVDYHYEILQEINELLRDNKYVCNEKLELFYWGIVSYIVAGKTPTLYIKRNEWERVFEGEGVVVAESVEDLDLEAEAGKVACVVSPKEKDVPLNAFWEYGYSLTAIVPQIPQIVDVSNGYVDVCVEFKGKITKNTIRLCANWLTVWVEINGEATTIATYDNDTQALTYSNCDIIDTINNIYLSSDVYEKNAGYVDEDFLNQFFKWIVKDTKTELYVKNKASWERFSAAEVTNNLTEGGVDKALSAEMGKVLSERIDEVDLKLDNVNIIVNSVDELPEDAPVGSTAMVKSQTEVPAVKNIPKSGKLGNISLVSNAGTLSFPTTQGLHYQIYTGGFESLPGSLKTISLINNGYPPNFTLGLKLPSSSGDVATWDSEGKLIFLDQSAIDAFNDMLNTDEYVVYGTGLSDYAYNYLSQLVKTNGTKLVSAMYVKEDSWEEYDKDTKDKVATLEAKVAELETKIQELLNSLQTN